MNIEQVKAFATLLVTVALNVANVAGYALNFDTWYNAVFGVLAVASLAWSWWKNQNVTEAAQQAQLVLDHLKAEKRAEKLKEGE